MIILKKSFKDYLNLKKNDSNLSFEEEYENKLKQSLMEMLFSEMPVPPISFKDKDGNYSDEKHHAAINAPIFMDEDDILYLYQFPPEFWTHALAYRYVDALYEAKVNPNYNDIQNIKLGDGSRSVIFRNRNTFAKKLVDKIERTVDVDHFMNAKSNDPDLKKQYAANFEKYGKEGKDLGGLFGTDMSSPVRRAGTNLWVAKGTNTNTSIVGTTDAYPSVRNVEIDLGNFITAQSVASISKVAVLGPTTRDDLFGSGTDPIGQTVRIKNIEFKIIGVTKAKGGSGFGSQDDMIYIPLSSAQRYLAGEAYVTTISVQAVDSESMTGVQQAITELLLTRHHISDATQADFSTFNQADIVATASSITSTFTILLSAVAGISLIVGGIGIMNMMLTSVTERTKEIGLRKAIGAKNVDISIQFLVEAVTLTFLGGAAGILLGVGISYGITYTGLLQTSVSLSSILLAFGVSTVIGIVFGYYPARHAASLNPIEALRFE
jgi:putative ABC transport system permease protein